MSYSHEVKAGIFVMVCLAVLAASVFVLGSDRQIFNRQYMYQTAFKDIGGLNVGAPVRIGGITVGRVKSIGFSSDHSDPRVHVRFLVNRAYAGHVCGGSEVTISTQGLLGDKYLSLSSDVSGAEPLAEGSFIEGREPADISQALEKAQVAIENAVEVSKAVYEVMDQVKRETIKDLNRTVKTFGDIAEEIKTGKGLVHKLVYSEEYGDKLMSSLTSASQQLDKIVTEVSTGKGLIHSLVYEPNGKETVLAIAETAKNLSYTAKSISEISNQIRDGQGLMHEVVYGKSPDVASEIKEITSKLNAAASALQKASEAISRGQGTIGALLVDSSLYDNLVQITDGAKRSLLLRAAINKALEADKK